MTEPRYYIQSEHVRGEHSTSEKMIDRLCKQLNAETQQRHTYYMSLVWNGGNEKHWSESIRSCLTAYNAVLRMHPNAIGTVVGLRITPR